MVSQGSVVGTRGRCPALSQRSRRTLSSGQKRSPAHGRSLTVLRRNVVVTRGQSPVLSRRSIRPLVHGQSLTVSKRSVVGTRGRRPALSRRRHSGSKSDVALDPVYICGLETSMAMRLEAQAVQLCCMAGHKLSSQVPGSTVDRRLLVNSGATRGIAQNGYVS